MISPRCQNCGCYIPGNSPAECHTAFNGDGTAVVQTAYACPKCGEEVVLAEEFHPVGRTMRLGREPVFPRFEGNDFRCPTEGCGNLIRTGPIMIEDGSNSVSMTVYRDCDCSRCGSHYVLEEDWKRQAYDVYNSGRAGWPVRKGVPRPLTRRNSLRGGTEDGN